MFYDLDLRIIYDIFIDSICLMMLFVKMPNKWVVLYMYYVEYEYIILEYRY